MPVINNFLHSFDRKGTIFTGVFMVWIKLVPDTTHCIENVARNEHEKLTRTLLRNETCNDSVSGKIELLRTFLETADFKALRKQSDEYLHTGKRIAFIIRWKRNSFSYEIVPEE
jgi:hypothetical protein